MRQAHWNFGARRNQQIYLGFCSYSSKMVRQLTILLSVICVLLGAVHHLGPAGLKFAVVRVDGVSGGLCHRDARVQYVLASCVLV